MKTIAIWCLFTIFVVMGFWEARTISQFHTTSLRFYEPISGHEAFRVRQHSINTDAFWPTFWTETHAILDVSLRQSQVPAIFFSGDASLVWQLEFITGTAPSSIDNNGIALSEQLAHNLWGSTDIVGMSLYVDGEWRTVRGVFRGILDLALISFHIEDTSQNFTAVELWAGYDRGGITRNEAEDFARASGLGQPNYILTGSAISLARFMSVLPLVIPIGYAFALIIKWLKKYYPMTVAPLFFGIIILFAILLPTLLNQIPAWLIPTRWSDFSFWGDLVTQANSSLREFLSVNPVLRDVELRIRLLRQLVILMLSICCGILVCVRHDVAFPLDINAISVTAKPPQSVQ